MAAARSKLYAPQSLLDHMTDRLHVLGDGPHDVPVRQQTMRQTIAWSYDLLQPREQWLFRRLAVFVGGFTLEAAQAVADAEAPRSVVTALAALLDQSLVQRAEADGAMRFSMLETIRSFGLEQLAFEGEEVDARTRHADYFHDLASSVALHRDDATRRDDRWRTRLIPEQDNLRQALAWFAARGEALSLNTMCASLTEHWFILAQFEEGRHWLERAMTDEAGVSLSTRACIHSEAGWLAVGQGDDVAAKSLLDQGLAMAREVGDPHLLIGVLHGCGKLAYQQGDLVHAETLFAETAGIARGLPTSSTLRPLRISGSLSGLGAVALTAGNIALATARYTAALRLGHVPGGARARTFPLYGLGLIQLHEGHAPEAAAAFLEAIALAWMIHEEVSVACLLCAVAAASIHDARPETAARLIGTAEASDARTGAVPWPVDRELMAWCGSWIERQPAAVNAGRASSRCAVVHRTGRGRGLRGCRGGHRRGARQHDLAADRRTPAASVPARRGSNGPGS
jgi:non-specific serine/threonine protein kinase